MPLSPPPLSPPRRHPRSSAATTRNRIGSYFRATREPRYSVLFALPLLLLYESLAMVLGPVAGGVRNAADVVLRQLAYSIAGPYALPLLGAALLGFGAWLVVRDARAHGWRMRPRWFGLMLVESAVLAVVFGFVVATVTANLLGVLTLAAQSDAAPTGAAVWLMLSLGAGLYEELVFRVLLVTGITALGVRLLGMKRNASLATAVVASAVLFSVAHHIGPFGDQWELPVLAYRFVAGLAFSAMYAVRGFGVTAWTHALYDVWVLVLRAL